MLISSNIKFTTTTVNDTTISATALDGKIKTTTTTKLKIRKQKKYKYNNKQKLLPQPQIHHHHLRRNQQRQNHHEEQQQPELFFDELQNQSDDENDFLNLVPNSNPVKFLFEKFTTNKSANCNKIFLLKLCFLKNQFKKLKSSLESISAFANTTSIDAQKLNDDYKRGVEIADHIISLLNFHIDYFINQEQQEDASVNVDDVNNGSIRIRKRKIG